MLHFHKVGGNGFSTTMHRVDLLSQKALSNHSKDFNVLSKFWKKSVHQCKIFVFCQINIFWQGKKTISDLGSLMNQQDQVPCSPPFKAMSAASVSALVQFGLFSPKEVVERIQIYWGTAVVQKLQVWFLHTQGSHGSHGGNPTAAAPQSFPTGLNPEPAKNHKVGDIGGRWQKSLPPRNTTPLLVL